MTKLFWNFLKLSPVIFAATFFAANSTQAAEVKKTEVNQGVTSVNHLSQKDDSLGQVTSVSQFSDVQPTDWAFQALQSLVERYGCIAGYPNGTYRGNRAMTRYEFAAGLNACLDRVNELIATATADLVKKEDLTTLQRLQEEFGAELATLRGRVDALEARTAQMEANQFSTTTKLVGEAVFSVNDAFGDGRAVSSQALLNDPGRTRAAARGVGINDNVTFSDRIRLSLNSSFTGKDLLQIRLQAGNVVNNSNSAYGTASTGTNMSRLAYDGFDTNQNGVVIDKINYAFDLKDIVRVKVDANNGEFYENVSTFNPDFASSARGSLSRYGRFSPIYRQGQGGAGATVSFNPTGPLTASVGYLAGGRNNVANNPILRDGLFDGNYAALGQINIKPTKAFNLGLTYARTYQSFTDANRGGSGGGVNVFESTGSALAAAPFGTNVSTAGNHYGVEATVSANQKVTLSGWGGYSQLEAKSSSAGTATTATTVGTPRVANGSQAEAFYYGATLAIKDFGKQGNVLGFIFGVPPKVSYSDVRFTGTDGVSRRQRDRDTTYQLEGQYKFKVNDNISVTPGVIVLFNPEHNTRNDTEYVGTLRTTFTF